MRSWPCITFRTGLHGRPVARKSWRSVSLLMSMGYLSEQGQHSRVDGWAKFIFMNQVAHLPPTRLYPILEHDHLWPIWLNKTNRKSKLDRYPKSFRKEGSRNSQIVTETVSGNYVQQFGSIDFAKPFPTLFEVTAEYNFSRKKRRRTD